MTLQDHALIKAYTSFGVSVDRIAVFLHLRRQFLDHLPVEVRSLPDDDLVWRLVQLRKNRKLPVIPSEN